VNRSYLAAIETAQPYVGLEVTGKIAEALEVEPAGAPEGDIEEEAVVDSIPRLINGWAPRSAQVWTTLLTASTGT